MFSIKSPEIIDMLSLFSYAICFFVSGVKIDIGMIKRTGKKALFTGVVCMFSPLLISLLVQIK